MDGSSENSGNGQTPSDPVANILFSYIRDIIYRPSKASLDIETLPESFRDFGKGLLYLNSCIDETRSLAMELSRGNLDCKLPPPTNEIASYLKTLHSSLKHLTWQAQQIARGDYHQRVSFMGDFSEAFNNMIGQLDQRRKIVVEEKNRLEMYVHLIIENCPNPILLFDSDGKLIYASNSWHQYCKLFEGSNILGKRIHELFEQIISEQSLREIERLYEGAITDEHMYETQLEMDFGEPESRGFYKIQMTPMTDKKGNVAGIIVFFTMLPNAFGRVWIPG